MAVVPLGAVGVPWNGWTALLAFVIVVAVVAALRRGLRRYRDTAAEALAIGRGQVSCATRAVIAPGITMINRATRTPDAKFTALVWLFGWPGFRRCVQRGAPAG